MAASLIYPAKKVVATVGDGGFLYSLMELETAVRLKENITDLVFRDGGYNMVAFQQELLYGQTWGTDFANPDIVKYAESLGGVGLRVNHPAELLLTLRKALEVVRNLDKKIEDLLRHAADWPYARGYVMAKTQSKDNTPGRVSAQPRLHQRAAEIQGYGTVCSLVTGSLPHRQRSNLAAVRIAACQPAQEVGVQI